MTESLWTSGPEGSNDSHPSEPDSRFAELGLAPETATPTTPNRADVAADSFARTDGAPLTRRELRAREQEQAALAAAPAPTVVSRPSPVPQQRSLPQQPFAPQVAPTVADASSAAMAPAVFNSFQADTVSATDLPSRRSGRVPRKPKALRPVALPRGATRPRAAISAPLRPSVVHSHRKPFKRRMLKKLMTLGAMVGAGLMMVSTTIPANAFYPNADEVSSALAAAPKMVPAEAKTEVQSVSVESTAELTLARDGYTATSLREQIFLRYGNRSFMFMNNPNGTIQWPFPIGVPISSGFGERMAPCNGCSSYHQGVDFTPGGGTPIQAIADGVVSKADDLTWGLGTHVVIDHRIDGRLVQSYYAHMKAGSVPLVVGQEVKVTDFVGLVGSTGISTGDHLHLEIHVNGVQVDPFTWLKENAN